MQPSSQQTTPALMAQKLAMTQLGEERARQEEREAEAERRLQEVLSDEEEAAEGGRQAVATRQPRKVILQGRPVRTSDA